MKCQAVQTWLMQVETLQVKDWPRNMNRHLKKCAACAKTARALYQMEAEWRGQSLPAECDKAKAAFLAKLPTLEQPIPEKPEKPPRRRKRTKVVTIPARRGVPYRWLAVAAVLFLGVILTGQFWPRNARAASDVVGRLIDLDVDMTNADAADRKRLLEEKEPDIKKDMEQADLSGEDRELAEGLLDDAHKLAAAADDVAEAEVVTRIADRLYSRCNAHDRPGDETQFERCGQRYMRFKKYGYEAMKERVSKRFEKGGHDKGGSKINHRKQVERIFEHPAEHSRPDLDRKLEKFGHKDRGGHQSHGRK